MKRRAAFWSLLALFSGLVIWWLLHVPYEPRCVFRAIPANAGFVSVHDGLAERLDVLSRGPLSRALFHLAGAAPESLNSLAGNPEVRRQFNRVAGRRLVFAYVPSLGGTGRDAWVFSSWIGGYGQCLRWLTAWRLVPDLTKVGNCRSRQIWHVKIPSLRHGLTLSLSVAEGVIMGCVSSEPQGVRYMLDAYGRISASILSPCGPTTQRFGSSLSSLSRDLCAGTSPDRGWVKAPSFELWYELSEHTSSGFSGCIRTLYQFAPAPALRKPADLNSLGRILGDIPEAVCVLPSKHVEDMLCRPSGDIWSPSAWSRIVSEMLKENAGSAGDKHVFVCMLGGEYCGRFKSIFPSDYGGLIRGFPLPAFMAGVEIDDADRALDLAFDTVDRMNEEYRLGLVPQPVPVGDCSVVVLEGTGDDLYSSFRLEERVAYAICGGWLLISSNAETLTRIVARFQRDEAVTEAGSGRWLRHADKARSAAYLWSDLSSAGVTLKNGLAVWRLALGTGPDTAKTRKTLDSAIDWMETVRRMGECSCELVSSGTVSELRFEFQTN